MKPGKSSLVTVMSVPFLLEIILAVGLVSAISLYGAQTAVRHLAWQLHAEVTNQVCLQLDTYTDYPAKADQLLANAAASGALTTSGTASLRYLWQMAGIFDQLSWIYYSDQATGDFIGIKRPEWVYTLSNQETNHEIWYYGINADGTRGSPVKTLPKTYDPRFRPWYQSVVQNSGIRWSEVYQNWGNGVMTLSLASPVYGADSRLAGVCAADIFLPDISTFLHGLQVSNRGSVFIMDRDGTLVADSTGQDGNAPDRPRMAAESGNGMIRHTAGLLAQQYPDLKVIRSPLVYNFSEDSGPVMVSVTPYTRPHGLDWLIVVAVPESDITGPLMANTRSTVLLCAIAMLLTMLIAYYTARRIARPILRLSQAAENLASGRRPEPVKIDGPSEVAALAASLDRLSRTLGNGDPRDENSPPGEDGD